MRPKRAVFRLEASSASGLGHIARCSALARALVTAGWTAAVAASDDSDPGLLRRAGLDVMVLQGGAPFAREALPTEVQRADANLFLDGVNNAGGVPTWVVVDHYGLDRSWERDIRASGARILALEDFGGRRHDADLVVTDSPDPLTVGGPSTTEEAVVLQGLAYALLADEYAAPSSSRSPPYEAPFRTTVVYGGSDPTRETEAVLSMLARHQTGSCRPVNIVIGPGNPRAVALERLSREVPGAAIHRGPALLAGLLRQTDLLFTAGGQVLLEGLVCGCACFVTVTSSNQIRITEYLEQLKVIEVVSKTPNADRTTLEAAIAAIPQRVPELLRHARESAVVDTLGPTRVMSSMDRLSPADR